MLNSLTLRHSILIEFKLWRVEKSALTFKHPAFDVGKRLGLRICQGRQLAVTFFLVKNLAIFAADISENQGAKKVNCHWHKITEKFDNFMGPKVILHKITEFWVLLVGDLDVAF